MENQTTRKCEICGEVLPSFAFSKSYPNRCRQCVAKVARQKRAANKQDGKNAPLLIIDEPKMDRERQRYELASVALQGLLRHSSIEGLNTADLAETAVDLADEMIKRLYPQK